MSTQLFTSNSKTLLSIDFNRKHTCETICSYCYVDNMERIYPAYAAKITRNHTEALQNPENFANTLNNEYRKLRNSKSGKWKRLNKLPVRVYGSGDYIPAHYNFLQKLNFKFYIISKTLTSKLMEEQLKQLLQLDNLTKVVLSFDANNLEKYDYIKKYLNADKIAFSYTGMPVEFEEVKKKYSFNIFFNIGDKKLDKEYSRKFKEQCPCDSGVLAHKESCSYCNKCWRSSATINRDF